MSSSQEDIRKRADIDRQLSLANALRVKGDFVAGEDACRKALEIDPDDLRAGEMLGEFLYERGKLEEARDQFKQLLERDKSLSRIERRYAMIALEIGDRERQRDLVQDVFARRSMEAENRRNAGLAMLLSAVAPGVGQIYNGEFVKGGIVLASFLLSLIVVGYSPGTGDFIKQAFYTITAGRPDPQNPGITMQYPSVWFLLFAGIGTFAYIYAVIDAPIVAAKRGQENEEKKRP